MRSWVLILLAGCDQILGLSGVGPQVDAAIDAPGPLRPVSGRISQLFIYRDALTTTPVTKNLGFPANAITLAYETDTGSVTVPTDGDGNFMFMAPQGRYRLSVTTEGNPVVLDLDLATDHPAVQIPVLSRPNAVAVNGAAIRTTVALTAPVLFTTGIWHSQLPFPPLVPGTFEAPWMFEKLDASEGDRVYAIDYASDPKTSTSENHIVAVAPGSVTLADGGTASITGPVERFDDVANPHLRCLGIDPQFGALQNRLGTPQNGDETSSHIYAVAAVPIHGIAPTTDALPIVFDPVDAVSAAVTYEDPFALPISVLSGVTLTRLYGKTTLTSQITEWHEIQVPANTTCAGTEGFDVIEPPLAVMPTLAGTMLSTDDLVIDRAGRRTIELTWLPIVAGIGWEIELAEVGPPGLPAVVHAVFTDQNTIELPSSLFQPGRHYTLSFTSLAGLTGASSGDFETVGPRFAVASSFSHAFTVQ